jgi:ribulose 1,5-bisphosphate synthetase/thiazole synthase
MKTLNTIDEKVTSGIHKSYWTDSVQPLVYNTLSNDAQTDVLIVGGGIAGLTTAYCLSKSGRKVILLEDGYLGSGESGRTTSHTVILRKYLAKKKPNLLPTATGRH